MQNTLINKIQMQQTRTTMASPRRTTPTFIIPQISCSASAKHSRNQSKNKLQLIIPEVLICDLQDQPANIHILSILKLPDMTNTKARPITQIQNYQEESSKEQQKLKKQLSQEKVSNDQLLNDLAKIQTNNLGLMKTIDKLTQMSLKKDFDLKKKDKENKDLKYLLQQADANIVNLQSIEKANLLAREGLAQNSIKKDQRIKELQDHSKTCLIDLGQTQEFSNQYQELLQVKQQLAKQEKNQLLLLEDAMRTILMLEFHNVKEHSQQNMIQQLQLEVTNQKKNKLEGNQRYSQKKTNKLDHNKENENIVVLNQNDVKTEQMEQIINILKQENRKLDQLCQRQEQLLARQGLEYINLKKSLFTCNVEWFLNEQVQVLSDQVENLKTQEKSYLTKNQYRSLLINAKNELIYMYRLMRQSRSKETSINEQQDETLSNEKDTCCSKDSLI